MLSTYEVFEPLHMLWMGIWNHQQLVTMAFDDPDYESWPKAYVTAEPQTTPSCSGCGSTPMQTHFTSLWSPYEVFEQLHMLWMGIWNHQRMVTMAFDDPD